MKLSIAFRTLYVKLCSDARRHSVSIPKRPPRRLAGLLIFTLTFLPSTYTVAQVDKSANLPLAPHATVIQISKVGYFTEPSIAVDPKNSNRVTAVYQDPASAAYSTDKGSLWTRAKGTASKSYRVSGDVSVTYDNRGDAILCYIAFDKLGSADYWGHDATRNGIFIRRSLDGGKTWEAHEIPVDSQATVPGIPFEDKPYIVADNTHSKYSGNLYIGWTEWRLTESVILFSRSTDRGLTWSKPIIISDHAGLPRDDNGADEGFSGTVTADGVVHVIWTDGCHIIYTFSKDGGKTFVPTSEIIKTAPAFFKPNDIFRANGFPEIACNPKDKSKLYITWSDYRNGDIDVFESYSYDDGKSWSEAVRVNNDPVHDGSDHFFQWIAVDPIDSSINIMFYDRRFDPSNRRASIVLARSTDGGKSFVNYLWTDSTFSLSNVFIGDYTGLAAYGGKVYGTWTEKLSTKSPEESKPRAGARFFVRHSTAVFVGTADFGTAKSNKSDSR